MHDFPNDLPIEKAPKFFYKKYQRRFSNLNKMLKSGKTICFFTNRQITLNEMQKFISQINKLYCFKQIYFINIYDTFNAEIELYEKFEELGATYIIYKFNDEHRDGREKSKNPNFWLGNIEYWDTILSKIKLNKKFKYCYKIKKFIFSIRNDFSTNKPHYVIQILGIRLKFKITL